MIKYDALVIPTYWDAEGYPGVVIEAYMAGIPVIISKIGGIPEIVEDGKTGFLTKPHDIDSIIKAIKCFENSDHNVISCNCRQYFDNYFSSDVVNERVIRIMMGK